MSHTIFPKEHKILYEFAKKKQVRTAVRSICIEDNKLLTAFVKDDPESCFHFPGGELDFGKSFEEMLHIEYYEEFRIKIEIIKYLFLAENMFKVDNLKFHAVEVYFLIRPLQKIEKTYEEHLDFKWIPISELGSYNVKPEIVKKIIIDNKLNDYQFISNIE